MKKQKKQLTVDLGERSYPIYIGEDLLDELPDLFKERGIGKGSPLMIITDRHVASLYLDKAKNVLEQGGYTVVTAVTEPGEKTKSLSVLEDLVEQALRGGLDRRSVIVALGGGVVGDLAGFAAASYMRGIRFVQIPTTILAHDSSVGGKVAVNHRLAKNVIGAFHQPEMVVFDTKTLLSLPEREVRAGLAEVVKHGLIWDREFVRWCEEQADRLLSLDPGTLQTALYEGCRIKSVVVSEDEKESGLRAILNLGHTIGHALEAVAEYDEWLHGEAISVGMVGAARIAERLGYPSHIPEVTERVLKKFGLPVRLPQQLDVDRLMEAMSHDKKFKEGKMVFVVPTEIGKVRIHPDLPSRLVREVVESLKREE